MTEAETEIDERPVHTLISSGDGHFSRGHCSTCEWNAKGHIDDIQRRFDQYHENENPDSIPSLVTIPKPTGDEFLDRLEWLIIMSLARAVDFGQSNLRFYASGLAVARGQFCQRQDPDAYIADMIARISHLPKRRRALLRDPNITRARQHELMQR